MFWSSQVRWLIALGPIWLAGCASTPPLDNPLNIRTGSTTISGVPCQPTSEGYAEVYDRVIDSLDDYFEIKPTSRYSGSIETYPRVAPGWEQPWKPSTPDADQRWIATTQSMRHSAVVKIWAAETGGYQVYVEVYKELEDLPQPQNSRSNTTIFRDAATVDRHGDLNANARSGDLNWIPAGKAPHRDYAFEQAILQKILRHGALK